MWDYMSQDKLSTYQYKVIELTQSAFPHDWSTKENRSICRIYERQVVEPLLKFAQFESQPYANVLETLGKFLLEDGKYNDSLRIFSRVLQIRISLFDERHPSTLMAMASLAATYRNQGQWEEAVTLEEKV